MEGAMEGAPDTGVMGRRDRVVEALRIMQTWLAGWYWLAWVGGDADTILYADVGERGYRHWLWGKKTKKNNLFIIAQCNGVGGDTFCSPLPSDGGVDRTSMSRRLHQPVPHLLYT